ncbi:MAG TPA: hypothetical protein VGU27_08795, partial [Candidatus Eisenbacteria bacterium]|nr:hypothetical protein [Candidatus Eisenbacteria bacterium]
MPPSATRGGPAPGPWRAAPERENSLSDPADPLLARFDAAGVPAGPVLLAGDAVRLAPALRARGLDVRCATSAPDLGVGPGACAAAVIERVLARDPWDRWALQRL